MIIYILYILFNHFDSEGTPNSKITGPYSSPDIQIFVVDHILCASQWLSGSVQDASPDMMRSVFDLKI
jgi:hypothetical protein